MKAPISLGRLYLRWIRRFSPIKDVRPIARMSDAEYFTWLTSTLKKPKKAS